MNDLKGIIEDCNKSDLVSDKIIKKIIEIIGQEEWQDLHDENNDICTTMGELIITLKGITELEAQIEQLVYLHEEDVNTIKLLNKQIEKMRNFQNCDYQLHVTDCPIFKSGGHIRCEKCPHWILQEVKENEYD